MQYRFTLPADYNMAVIEQRIANNGAKLDGFPGLLFKTWLALRVPEVDVGDAPVAGRENYRIGYVATGEQ